MSYNPNFPRMTVHARQQLAARFDGLLSFAQVCRSVNQYAQATGFQIGQTYVEIARYAQNVSLPDGTSGDIVYAVVDKRFDTDAGRICTILIRPSTNTDRTFREHTNIAQNHTVWKY